MKRKGLIFCLAAILAATGIYFSRSWKKGHFLAQEMTSAQLMQKHYLKKQQRINRHIKKYDSPDKYYRYNAAIRGQDGSRPVENAYPFNYRYKALKKALKSSFYTNKHNFRTEALDFVERGPSNVPGRTRTLLAMPDDPEHHWLAGAVGGGIWETTDSGKSWSHKTKGMPSLAISCMAMCANQPTIIYAGTGEGVANVDALDGAGMLKSIDGGQTWQSLAATAQSDQFAAVTRVVVDPDNADHVLATTGSGRWDRSERGYIMKSTDGGVTWRTVYNSSFKLMQIIANPMNFKTLFAALDVPSFSGGSQGQVIIKSTDMGEHWAISNNGIYAVYGRIEMAAAPTDSSVYYASALGNVSATGADLYVTQDAGDTWMLVDQLYKGAPVDFLDGIGWYANTIAVNPYDAKEVYYGGVNLWKTIINTTVNSSKRSVVNVNISRKEASMWSFVNFGATFYNGRLELNSNLNAKRIVDVAIITGKNVHQKAHRFIVNKRGAGVEDGGYLYQDYVDVPLQVWDLTNNRQLMISFRDQQEDGLFNLITINTTTGQEAQHSREYLFIHAVPYSTTPNDSIAQNGGINKGQTYDQLYFMWPVLADGLNWDIQKNIADTISITYENVKTFSIDADLKNVSDAYVNYDSINTIFYKSFPNYFHPDHHHLTMVPTNPDAKIFRIIDTSDGGVYLSKPDTHPGTREGDWSFSGYGYNSGQFYSAAKKPGQEVYIGGMQDNGTWISPDGQAADASTQYSSAVGGDGFDVLWNAKETNQIIASSQNNAFYRSTNGGKTWSDATTGLEGTKPFLSKLANANSNPNAIFTVTSLGVYRSEDFGNSWALVQMPDSWIFSDFTDVKVSAANYRIVWSGGGISASSKMQVSVDGGKTFIETSSYAGANFNVISGMATHPTQDSTAYVLISYPKGPKILRTRDLGRSWEDISGYGTSSTSSNGFPDVAVYSLLVRPDAPNILWAGTEIGIFESTDDGASWAYLDCPVGSAAVWDMNVMDDQVVIATHGRGIFTATLAAPVTLTFRPKTIAASMSVDKNFKIKLRFPSAYDSSFIYLDDQLLNKLDATNPGDWNASVSGLVPVDSAWLNVNCYREGKMYSSDPKLVTIFDVADPVRTYDSDFETQAQDFAGYGFGVKDYQNFNNMALHSFHPFAEGQTVPNGQIDYNIYLKKPIIVADRNANFYFDNVALLEPGKVNTKAGDNDFYDYVVIEGSSNGLTWKALYPGFDAGKDNEWRNAYTNGTVGGADLMKTLNFKTNQVFSAGDTILIRFRLHSDPLEAGWGWAIDNLKIQSVITGLEDDIASNTPVLYPNPASDLVHIGPLQPVGERTKVTIYTISGDVVRGEDAIISDQGLIDVNVAELPEGLYLVVFHSAQQQVRLRLLIDK